MTEIPNAFFLELSVVLTQWHREFISDFFSQPGLYQKLEQIIGAPYKATFSFVKQICLETAWGGGV